METIRLVDVGAENLEREHICCAIGADAENAARAAAKKAWLRDRLAAGHRFRKADVRGKAFIEYGPVEEAWFPVEGPGWTFAQCFWVAGSYKGKGLGARLLAACEADAGSGACFLAGRKKMPYLSDGAFLEARGYEPVDEALGGRVALWAKRLDPAAPLPRLSDAARACRLPGGRGVTIYWSPQCPFVPVYAREMAASAAELGVETRLVEVDSVQKAKALPSPFGIVSSFLGEEFLSWEPMTGMKFQALIRSRLP